MLNEFKAFIMKGNVMDMAVGIIIGGAFTAIVTSLVGDVLMPVIGAIVGNADFSNYFAPLSESVTASTLDAAKEQGAVLAYGSFITAIINFLIIAFVIFMIVKFINSLSAKEEEKKAKEPAAPPAQEVLLAEIRDLLSKKK
ncbi:MAG: large conductance mechanosensitive channel protein MscL [Hyphomicrobiales bacterium]|nr:MAG: large conductance mechanosensitive channel protein MscL [Hyphomicrobiales bacterium]